MLTALDFIEESTEAQIKGVKAGAEAMRHYFDVELEALEAILKTVQDMKNPVKRAGPGGQEETTIPARDKGMRGLRNDGSGWTADVSDVEEDSIWSI